MLLMLLRNRGSGLGHALQVRKRYIVVLPIMCLILLTVLLLVGSSLDAAGGQK